MRRRPRHPDRALDDLPPRRAGRAGALPAGERLVIKPNAVVGELGRAGRARLAGVEAAVAGIHEQGHDAIVEPFLNGSDVEVPVITIDGEPMVMPMMLFEQADPTHLRTYYEKRDLVDAGTNISWSRSTIQSGCRRIADMTRDIAEEFRPFDYGRFEFRLDARNRHARLPRGEPPGQSVVGEGVRPLRRLRRPDPGRADRDHPP